MPAVKAWKVGQDGAPYFPDDFEIVKKAVLQVTDIKNNNNKYYAIELHKSEEKGKVFFRVYTHYGRTDDLETNPDAGQKECRYFANAAEAEANYQSIYREKTSPKKGYKELSLASSKIGSQKARGTATGEVDVKTLERIKGAGGDGAAVVKQSQLHTGVQHLVRYIYDEATNALTSTVAAKITAHGIETPLGILTVGQIEKGEKILSEMYDIFQKKPKGHQADLQRLTGDFYSAIPHRIGRTRTAIESAVIDNLAAFEQKQSTLQLMKDMLQVNGEAGGVLFDAKVDQEYEALKCQLGWLDHDGSEYKELADHVIKSQVKSKSIKIKNIYTLRRPGEWDELNAKVGNEKLLFHGSRIQNWVGILSRGILLPKIVVSMGVNRTDAGWLGNGIYFGDAACTSVFYTTPGRHKTRLMAVARVALGKMKDYTKITYGLNAPPAGYDSTHGVRNRPGKPSEFADDEYVIYTTHQQRLEYLVELTA
jgi:poly [ADP-ribose] polymerase 2/3/4